MLPIHLSTALAQTTSRWAMAVLEWPSASSARTWLSASNNRLPAAVERTTKTNLRSQTAMRRIGMTYDPAEGFDDPDVEEGQLCRAVLYRKLPGAVRPDVG
jgi:hypothetical protein